MLQRKGICSHRVTVGSGHGLCSAASRRVGSPGLRAFTLALRLIRRLGTLSLGLGTLTLGLGTLSLGLGTLSLGLGTLSLGLGTLSLGLGTLFLRLDAVALG